MTSREPDERHISTADGRTLATHSWGIGTSTVVKEAALGASGLTWHAVAQELGPDVPVLAYDRPGIGDSPGVTGYRPLAHLATDLAAVVASTGVSGITLVGHSWGTAIVRRALPLMPPGTVTGLLLVEPAVERVPAYFSRTAGMLRQAQGALLPPLARTPLPRHLIRRSLIPALPDDLARRAAGAVATAEAMRAQLDEARALPGGLRELVELDLPHLPTTVVSGVAGPRTRARRQLVEAQQALAEACIRGRWVPAHASGHNVPLQNPALVADEIRRLRS